MLAILIFIAILNGAFIGMGRLINSRLGIDIGIFKASLWNHLIGFLFLSCLLIFTSGTQQFSSFYLIPHYAYLGGLFGVVFVAMNSYVLSRIGALDTMMLVISGQMVTSVVLDLNSHAIASSLAQIIGVVIIITGLYIFKSY